MSRFKPMTCLLALLLLLPASLVLAQTRTSPPTSTPPATTGPTTPTQRRGRRQPCWQQVGISQSAAQERRQIEENTRSQMESVCSDSSLSAQQKEQKIRQLREESRRQAEALISPQQEQELRACRQQRGGGRGGHGGHGGGAHSGEGPCGELPAATHGAKPFQQSGSASEQD